MKRITLALSALALSITTPLTYYTARQYLVQAEADVANEYTPFEVSDEDALPLVTPMTPELERLDGRRGVGGDYDSVIDLSATFGDPIDNLESWDDIVD